MSNYEPFRIIKFSWLEKYFSICSWSLLVVRWKLFYSQTQFSIASNNVWSIIGLSISHHEHIQIIYCASWNRAQSLVDELLITSSRLQKHYGVVSECFSVMRSLNYLGNTSDHALRDKFTRALLKISKPLFILQKFLHSWYPLRKLQSESSRLFS